MLIGGNAIAQDTNTAEPKNKSTETLDTTVLTGLESAPFKAEKLSSPRYDTILTDIPRTVTVVPKELLKAQGATTIVDALRNVPGISLQAGEGGTPAGDQLTMRGFSAINDFFVDGIRDIGGYTRDPFNYEQVEVAKGPNSVDSGRGSVGGSINLVTKTPHLEKSLEATLGFGTDSFGRGTIDYNAPIEALDGAAFRLNLMGNTEYIPGRDYVKNQRWAFAPSLAFGLGSDTVTTITYMYQSQSGQPDYGIPWLTLPSGKGVAPDVNFDNYYGLLERDYEHIDINLLTGEVRHKYNENTDLRLAARYGNVMRDSFITAPRFESGSTDTIRRTDFKTRDQTNEIMSVVLDSNIRFETGSLEHTFVSGIDYTRERNKNVARSDANIANAPSTSLYDPYAGGTYTMDIVEGATSVGRVNTLGIFAYDSIAFNEQWTLNGGVRYDNIHSTYAETGEDNLSNNDDLLSWRGALSYKPLKNGAIYIAYGTSANPSIADRVSLSEDTASLDPEETETFELGTKWDLLDQRLGLTAAVFHTDKTNGRTSAGRGYETVLTGEQRVQGFELGLTGQINDDWSVFGGYTYLNSEIKSSENPDEVGNPLPNTPEHSFSIWTNYQISELFNVGGGARYVGKRYSNGSNTREADSFITFDAALTYQITETIAAQLNVYNLADERYIDYVGGGHFIPGESRSASVSLQFAF